MRAIKIIILLAVSLLFLSPIFGQDTTKLFKFPHKSGDMWQYFYFESNTPYVDTVQNFTIFDSIDSLNIIHITQYARSINPIKSPFLFLDTNYYSIVLKDFRFGPEADEFERIYQIQLQKGDGDNVTIRWDLPSGLKMRVQDVVTGNIIDQTFESGIDSLVVTNPDGINKLKLTITFPSHYTPVELTSLIGEVLNNSIELKWKTATEKNNRGFEIERRLNSNWEKVGYFNGKGTTTNPNEYHYTDNFKYQSFKGIVSYRLKQIDLDGSYNYSDEINLQIDFTPKEYILYQNYPNPFNPSTTIKYAIPFESSVEIIIYNPIGQKVEEFNEGTKDAGYYDVVWQPKNLSSGVYFYSIIPKSTDGKNNYTKTLKMLLMK